MAKGGHVLAWSAGLLAALLLTLPALGDRDEAVPELGLRRGATWTYAFKTVGSEHHRSGLARWSYECSFRERILSVRHAAGFMVFEATRTLEGEKGAPPQEEGFLPRMGSRFYLVRGGELGYERWRGYALTTPPAYQGLGVYLQEGRLALDDVSGARTLYVLPLRAPAAWHETLEERKHADDNLFLGGTRVERRLAGVNTPLGVKNDCFALRAPTTTTEDVSVVCAGMGLVHRVEDRRAGSLIYRSETRLTAMTIGGTDLELARASYRSSRR